MEEVVTQFESFFDASMRRQLTELASAYPEKRSLEVDFTELEKFNPDLADGLLANPDEYLSAAKKAVASSSQAYLPASVQGEAKKFQPHVRIKNLRYPEVSVQFLGSEHLNKLVKVDGVISWITQISPCMKTAVWECLHCEHKTKVFTDKHAIKQPRVCPACNRSNFKLVEESSEFINIQRANMQDLVENLRGNAPTTHVELWIEDDQVNRIAPGEKVTISGILRLRPVKEGKGGQGRSSVYAKFLDVVHLEKKEEDFEALEVTPEEETQIIELSKDKKLYEKIVRSIAPGVFGYDEMKQSIALQLFGGTPNKFLPDGQRIRNDIHVLLIGDPGCLVADERVVMGNGAIERIGDLGERHLQEIELPMLTGQGYKRDVATVFHAYPKQPVLEILTESGKSIKGTYNHPLLAVNGMTREWKRLDEIKVGDRVATVPWIPCTITKLVETNWKKTKRHWGPRSRTKMPHNVDSTLAGLLGYWLGDGWVNRTVVACLVNEEEQDLVPLLSKAIKKKFGIVPKTRREQRKNKKPLAQIALYDVDAAANLQFLREKRVPKLIMRSGNKVASEFLAWLFEADGCVFSKGRGKHAIQLKSSSIELLRDVQVLLLRFGIHSRIVERNLCIRRADSIKKYSEAVGFRSKKKKAKLRELVKARSNLHHKRGKDLSERVVAVRPAGVADVFDVEIPKGHRFVANGVISHNTSKSTLLSYVSRLAPKCIMVGGKSASSVGLTASAEKDEITGGWILKAGAMVLANGGMVCVDELDKMNDEDRGAMHQSMEQQIISVAKAGLITQFQSRTSVLAAANPKHGRFDPNALPAQQFDLSPTLLSRFDLIFPIRDVLDDSQDRKIASHILLGHKLAAEKQKPADDSPVMPAIPVDFLRKYIAFARKNICPILSTEAAEKIKEFYLEMRHLGKQQNNYPITARYIEGIIRLAEASAKVRLSKVVEIRDAERAIALQQFVLKEVFMDKDTGRIDSDIISIGQPKSKIDKMRTILSIIGVLEKKFDQVDIDDVVKDSGDAAIDEQTCRRIIDDLLRQGELFSPKPGYVKNTTRSKD